MGGGVGFVVAGPGGDGDAEEAEGVVGGGGELEGPVGGDGEGVAGGYGDGGYGGGVGVGGAAPNLAVAFKDVPDFLDLLVAHGAGDLACGEDDFDHAGFLGVVAVVEEQAYLGAVGAMASGLGLRRPKGGTGESLGLWELSLLMLMSAPRWGCQGRTGRGFRSWRR